MQRWVRTFWLWALLLVAPVVVCAASSVSPAAIYSDQMVLEGTVYIYTLEDANGDMPFITPDQNHSAIPGGKYIPARRIYTEAQFPGLVSSVSTYTNEYGGYYLKKSGLVENSTYNVSLEVRAKALLGKHSGLDTVVTVFNESSDVYAVNGKAGPYQAQTGKSQTVDVYIGGPDSLRITNWWDDTYDDDFKDGNGKGIFPVASFWMTQKLQDFFKHLTNKVVSPNQLTWDTYIKYPATGTTHYVPGLCPPTKGCINITSGSNDRIYPSQFGVDGATPGQLAPGWEDLRASMEHEYSHQIMHNVFNGLPASNTGDHAPNSCSTYEQAWVEGWAEFLPAAIHDYPTIGGESGKEDLEYTYFPGVTANEKIHVPGMVNPVTNELADLGSFHWHEMIMNDCSNHATSEGEIAAVLWDIYDPVGWEYMDQSRQDLRPAGWKTDLRWYDRLYDGALSQIWSIFLKAPNFFFYEGNQPGNSFWSEWLSHYKNDSSMIHGLKAVLYNRGIASTLKPENAPVISGFAVDANAHKLTFQVSEADVEDRPYLYFNLGYKKSDTEDYQLYYSEDRLLSEVSSSWSNGVLSVTLDVPRGKLGRTMTLLVHDSMIPAFKTANLAVAENQFFLQCSAKVPTIDATALAVQGAYAYVADIENGLYIFDLSDPLHPRQVGLLQSNTNDPEKPWGGALDVAVQGNYAYITAYSGALVVADIHDPAHPTLAGYLALNGTPRAVALSTTRAYVAGAENGLAVVNILFPTTPWLESSFSLPREGAEVALHGSDAFVAAYESGLLVATTGLVPYLRGGVPVGDYDRTNGVAVDNRGLIYYSTLVSGLHVIDISTWDPALALLAKFMTGQVDPERAFPVEIGHLPLDASPGRAFIDGNMLYIAQGSGIGAYDITEPELVYQAAYINGLSAANEVVVRGDVWYAASGQDGLVVIKRSATQPANVGCPAGTQGTGNLRKVADWHGSVSDMAFAGNYGFIASFTEGLKVIDVANPSGQINTLTMYDPGINTPAFNALGVTVKGDYLYLTTGQGDLHVISIASSSFMQMRSISGWSKQEQVGTWRRLDVVGDFAYVCAPPYGLRVLNISNPDNLMWGGLADAAPDCDEVAVLGDYAYVTGFSSGLHIINVSTNRYYNQIASWTLPEGISGANYNAMLLDKDKRRLYVAALWKGLYILDVSDPFHPRQISSIKPGGSVLDVALAGNTAYLSDDSGSVYTLDVTDPAHPLVKGSLSVSDRPELEITAKLLAIHNGYLYVSTSSPELQVYQITP